MVDQWPASLMGCAGHPVVKTPTLDELVKAGTRFTNAYSATPVCIPARREFMTGTNARVHGDKCFDEKLPMPSIPSLPGAFASHGYQTFAVGKLHVYPQRDRIGFHDVILMEEGRHKDGMRQDDFERFLMRKGYAGLEFMHGMSNNDYLSRPWHLSEETHPTSWMTREMCETIKRKDPTRPAFWFLSYNHPHPPLAPLAEYLHMYDGVAMDEPYVGEWVDNEELPSAVQRYHAIYEHMNTPARIAEGRKAFYAQCTHIDHQIRTVVGTLREEGLLDDTAIVLTCDHGDFLGNHRLWGKNMFYEDSCKIPFFIIPPVGYDGMGVGTTDDRLVELRDIMPTLLDMAGLPIPESVNGISLTTSAAKRRDFVYGELWKDARATRMIRWGDYKLIYCPVTNARQLFNLKDDPKELVNIYGNEGSGEIVRRLETLLMDSLYGDECAWIRDGSLVGMSDGEKAGFANNNVLKNRELLLQRGLR